MSQLPPRREDRVIRWLLDGDPAIRWQTLRDLVGAPARDVERERRRVGREGWGGRLLARQDATGRWSANRSAEGGLYSPKWTSTTYTMLLLRDMGLAPRDRRALQACAVLLDHGLQRDGGINYGWRGSSETCITGIVLSILCHFELDDERVDIVADHLLTQQMADGGWNCQRPRGATHASVHTTINALEALALYEHRGRRTRRFRAAQRRGREFLLAHRLFRSHRTGEVIRRAFLRLSFPPTWRYDVLRALDHFRATRAPRDHRLGDAVDIVLDARREDGRWPLENRYRGKSFFAMERLGGPSRWNTLRALRVVRWWNGRPTPMRRPDGDGVARASRANVPRRRE